MNLEIQRHVFKGIRHVLLSLKTYMQFKFDFAQARLYLKGFTDEPPIGDRHCRITRHHCSFCQRLEQHLHDTFRLSAGLIIRKPGAAIFVELVGAAVSALLGNAWGVSTLLSGLIQGAFAELVFLAFRYRKYTLPVALLAGGAAGFGAWFGELWYSGNIALTWQFNLIYLICCVLSGIVLAGLLSWLLTRALARTGVLHRFAAGREF